MISLKNALNKIVKIAEDTDLTATLTSAKSYADNKETTLKEKTGLLQYAPVSTNALQVAISTGGWNGKIESIRTNDASSISNFFIKSGTVVALKRQYISSNGHAYVDIDMIYPFPNSKWRNVYNTGWIGWKLMAGQVQMWSGSAKEGASITISYPKAYFSSLDVYFTTGERTNIPLTDGNEDAWGSLVTTASNEFYIKSVHIQFINNTTAKILECKQKQVVQGTLTSIPIVKIVGRP